MKRRRIALLCPEPLRDRVQGIGIRFLEMSRLLRGTHHVTLWAPNEDLPVRCGEQVRTFDPQIFARCLPTYDVVLLHGHISQDYFRVLAKVGERERPALVVDLYDPFLIENLHYTPILGESVFYRDRAILFRQLGCGDFFLTSSDAQRLFYLGILTGLGRLAPAFYHEDPTLRSWIDVAPFGVHPVSSEDLKGLKGQLKGVVPGIEDGDRVIFFGGVYDWYDPLPLLEALSSHVSRGLPVRVVFCENPNREVTPQDLLERVRRWAEQKGWLGRHVFFIPWFPYEDRFRYYRDVDVAVCLHRPSLETELSLRTRVLDYLNAGLPVVATEGGEGSRMIEQAQAGVLVRPGDVTGIRKALDLLLADEATLGKYGDNGRRWVQQRMSWDRTLQPLVRFCEHPVKRAVSVPGTTGQGPRGAMGPPLFHWAHQVAACYRTMGVGETLRRIGERIFGQ